MRASHQRSDWNDFPKSGTGLSPWAAPPRCTAKVHVFDAQSIDKGSSEGGSED